MIENEISQIIVNCCCQIHVKLGPGLFESVYEQILFHELIKEELYVTRQQTIPVIWDGLKIDHGFRADLIVEEKVLVEMKVCAYYFTRSSKTSFDLFKAYRLKLGLLINFNKSRIKSGITRIANGL